MAGLETKGLFVTNDLRVDISPSLPVWVHMCDC